MQLWTDYVEAMRPEARAPVDDSRGEIKEKIGGRDPAADPTLTRDERVAKARKQMEVAYFPSPEAELREIAGVPCRVFTPKGPATAV